MKLKQGFTLIELLVSITIFTLAGAAIYSVFVRGVKAWQRGSIDRNYIRKIRIISEKMAREVRNSYKFSSIPFEGTDEKVMFPALVLSRIEGESYYQVGRVAYFYDEEKKAFCREEKSYPEVFAKKKSGRVKVLIKNINKLKLSYCYLDNATGEYKWKKAWKKNEQDTIPQAIKIEMHFSTASGRQEKFSRIIFIPIGTGRQKIKLGSIVGIGKYSQS